MKISNYAKAVIFLLSLTALSSSVYAQTVPPQENHTVDQGGVDTSGLFILLIIAVVLIVIVVAIVLHSKNKKNKKPSQSQTQQTTEKALVICPKCYNRIDADNGFCPKCGADIRPKVIQ
jgi:uncharacterized membrane protein